MDYLGFVKFFQNRLSRLICLLAFILLISSCTNNKDRFLPDTNNVRFQLPNGAHISYNQTEEKGLEAKFTGVGNEETFFIEKKEGFIKIKTSHGYYINYNNRLLGISKDSIHQNERFKLKPYKEYFELETLDQKKVILNESRLLEVASNSEGVLLKIGKANIYPASWYSIKSLHILPFITQFSIFLIIIFLFFKYFKTVVSVNRASFITVLVLGYISIFVIFNTKRWQTNKIIDSDAIIYYEYLPAAFIFNDLSFEFTNNFPRGFNGDIWTAKHEETGKSFPITSMGLGYMYLPFFLTGHFSAKLLGYTTYGYSEPYELALLIGCWLYVFLGLFYLRKILLTYFDDKITALTLVSTLLATNLFFYTVIGSTMSHAYSFFLFSAFIWHTIKWHKKQTFRSAVILGLIIGLISIVRPTNALLAIVFMLFNVFDVSSLINKVKLFWSFKLQILLLLLFGFIVWTPQLAFWKYATDQWFFFSYGDNNNFYFNNPHILDGLFSYRKGWLLYTPIMIFALLGIGVLFRVKKEWALPIFIFTSLNVYVIFSWWCWWYGGSFGSRPMVESYALLAIPLAGFYTWMAKKHYLLKYLSILIIVLATTLNLFQTQQTKTCLHWDGMTKESYWKNFTKLGYPEGVDDMIKPPDYEKARKGTEEYEDRIF